MKSKHFAELAIFATVVFGAAFSAGQAYFNAAEARRTKETPVREQIRKNPRLARSLVSR
jgi:hypothetical protein